MQLELCVLNGEKYKEVVPEGSLPTQSMLLACIIGHHTKALLKREGGDDAVLRCFLPAEGGRENLSELLLTTSSEVWREWRGGRVWKRGRGLGKAVARYAERVGRVWTWARGGGKMFWGCC
eukprot:366142-Chlamydomonas_euryale.AAC.7